jgi:hypothetical protein
VLPGHHQRGHLDARQAGAAVEGAPDLRFLP